MSATLECQNRIASPILPATPAARAAAYADAVMAAVLSLQAQLRDPDAAVSQAAAVAIVDLEKTRMRHDTPVAGTHAPSELLEPLGEPFFAPAGRVEDGLGRGEDWGDEEDENDEAEPDEETVERVRQYLQQEADEAGSGEVVSGDRAYQFARQALDRVRREAGASDYSGTAGRCMAGTRLTGP